MYLKQGRLEEFLAQNLRHARLFGAPEDVLQQLTRAVAEMRQAYAADGHAGLARCMLQHVPPDGAGAIALQRAVLHGAAGEIDAAFQYLDWSECPSDSSNASSPHGAHSLFTSRSRPPMDNDGVALRGRDVAGMRQSRRMVKRLKVVGVPALAMIVWTAVAGYGVLAGWWHRAIAPAGDAAAFMLAARQMMSSEPHGDLAIALVSKGQVADEHYSGLVDAVNRETVFPVASMSKWVTAVGVMQLAREGRINLDAPVARYLTRWTLPVSRFDLNGVTARRLLSHTAGLTDGLGFGDYRLDERVPSLEESLRAPRASTGQPTAIIVGSEPGSRWQYSGGGYLILQLLVEEVTQQPFGAVMQRAVLDPLELSCSSFERTPSPNTAEAYDAAGRTAPRFQYAAAGATGFSTCVRDMVRWVQAHVEHGPTPPLDADLLRRMREPHGSQFGADIWGLGTMLYAPTAGDAFVFGHDGQNDPAINAAVRVNPDNSDAIVVLTSGGRLLATRLASEWTYWQTGGPDFLVIGTAIREAVVPLIAGWLAVIVAAIVYARARKRAPLQAG